MKPKCKTQTHCSGCSSQLEPNRIGKQRYCRSCHAAYMRAHRPKYVQLSPDAKFKASARSMSKIALKRGQITKSPCQNCGCEKSQIHHPDYSRPLEVIWLCRPCHLAHHKITDTLQVSGAYPAKESNTAQVQMGIKGSMRDLA